eukprot:SAG31_NODE_756_length_12303_cov_8.918142_12_plen_59_part_00
MTRRRRTSGAFAAVLFVAGAVLLCAPRPCCGLDNGLALTPPLAYSTWNMFNDAINDTL